MHVIDLFDWGARNFSQRLAFSGAGGKVSCAEAWRLTNQVARALLGDGAVPGSRFAVLSPNCSHAMLAMLGGLRAGGAWCNVNLRAALEANVDILRRGRCGTLFFHSSIAEMIPVFTAAIPQLRRVVCLDADSSPYPSMAAWSGDHAGEFLDHRIPQSALGHQGSTGGTTGVPKLTQSTNDWLLMSTLAWATCWRFSAPPVNLAMAPITHAAGSWRAAAGRRSPRGRRS
jgi:acyl-CoA synthetase (AMP-forming)/AMP-acid ligase II